MLADAYEQLGYQAESGPWRSEYLMGAFELRNGVSNIPFVGTASPDIIKAMPLELLFDYLGVRLNGPKAAGKKIVLGFNFTDLYKRYTLSVENGVLTQSTKPKASSDAQITLSKATLDRIQLKELTVEEAIASAISRLTASAKPSPSSWVCLILIRSGSTSSLVKRWCPVRCLALCLICDG